MTRLKFEEKMQAENRSKLSILEPIINNIQFVYKPVSQSFNLDLSSGTINAEKHAIITPEKKSWDETMEEVLLDRAEAWEKLADL